MRYILWLVIFVLAASVTGVNGQSGISSEIAPTGKLRVGVSVSSGALVTRTKDDKISGGLAVELGKLISEKLEVPFELVSYPNDYVYVAGPGRDFSDASKVDRPGVKIGAGPNSVSDQFLSKNLKSAQLIPISSGAGGADELRTGKVDVWATGASNVPRLLDRVPGAKMLPGAFTSERQGVFLPKGKSSAAQKRVAEIITEAKKAGMVQKTIKQLNLVGVRAAPD